MKPNHQSQFDCIVAAIDATSSDQTVHALNRRILEFADTIAKRESAVLHVVCAWDIWMEIPLRVKLGGTVEAGLLVMGTQCRTGAAGFFIRNTAEPVLSSLSTRNIPMFLRAYRLPRMVVLKPSDTAFEAARAIENNGIGAIIVQDERRVVGLLTDRDLAVRVVGGGLDPKLTTLDDVMTKPVFTLAPTDSDDDAIWLMQQRNIRRIPLVESGRIVGIVTLDDLLLDVGLQSIELQLWRMITSAHIFLVSGLGGDRIPVCGSSDRLSYQPILGSFLALPVRCGHEKRLDACDETEPS